MIKNNAYVNIQGWMINELNLSGNDLLVYAIIYGFSQDGKSQFTGSLQYLADWCNSSKRGIQKNLQNLLDKGLIEKEEHIINGVKLCKYQHSQKFYSIEQSSMGIEQSSTNNIDNTIDNKDITNTNVLDILQKKPKRNMYQKCTDEIDERYTDKRLKDILVDYLKMCLERKDEKRLHAYAQWKGLLDKLDRLADNESDKIAIVEQSIKMYWATFVELKANRSDAQYRLRVFGEQNVKSDHYTDDEKAEIERWQKENNVPTF